MFIEEVSEGELGAMAEETDPINWEDLLVYTGEDDTDGGQPSVYIIMEEPDDRRPKTYRCKIGRSTDPKRRCQNLQTGNSRDLRVAKEFQVRNASTAEKAAHAVARDQYEWKSGEWFEVNQSQFKNFIADIGRAVSGL